jgi:hypothetical protein
VVQGGGATRHTNTHTGVPRPPSANQTQLSHASATSVTATAVTAAEELRKRGRVRKLAPSDGWQTAPAAVARRVVEDEQEDAVADEEVVQEEDLSDEEADSAGPAWEILAHDRAGWRGGDQEGWRVWKWAGVGRARVGCGGVCRCWHVPRRTAERRRFGAFSS